MNFTYLTSFYYVVTKNSFSKAAAFLGYSQGNISQQIRKLEDFYGTPLLFKRKQKIILTSNGKEVYEFAEKVIKEHAQLQAKIKHKQRAQIKIGTIDSISANILMPCITEVKRTIPATNIQVLIESEQQLLDKLDEDELDIIIIFDKLLPNQPTYAHYYAEETFEIVRRKTHVKKTNTLEMILTDKNCSYRKAFLDQYQKEMNISISLEVESTESIKKIMERGTESVFLPKYVTKTLSDDAYEKRPLKLDSSFYIQILYSPEKNNQAVDQLVAMLLKDVNFQFQSK